MFMKTLYSSEVEVGNVMGPLFSETGTWKFYTYINIMTVLRNE